MGWASGSELASALVYAIQEQKLTKKVKEALYYKLIIEFEHHDCDTMDECLGIDPVYDKVFNEMYPDFND